MLIKEGTNIPQFPKIRGEMSNIHYPCYTETKLDGEANVYFNGCLISKSSGKIRSNFPVTDYLNKIFPKGIALFGELYWEDGKFGALYKFLSNQKSDKLKFAIFDIALDGATYEERRESLLTKIPPTEFCYIMPTRYCPDIMTLNTYIKDNFAEGYEGLVVKNSDSILTTKGHLIETQTGWVKRKHKTTTDCLLVRLDPVLERGDILYNGTTGTKREVGVKIVHKYKKALAVGDILEIEHQGELNGGSLRHPVYRGKFKRDNV